MKPNLRTIASTTIAILLLAPLILAIAPLQAQLVAATISSVSSPAYPGEPVNVTIRVDMATVVYVYLCADRNCTHIWAQTWFAPPSPGLYPVSLRLPENLSNAQFNSSTGMLNLYVVVQALGIPQIRLVPIAPKIVVSPPQTTVVSPFINASRLVIRNNSVTIKFLGYRPNDTITQIVFRGPTTVQLNTSIRVHPNGTASYTVNLRNLTGYGLPRGNYTVYGVEQGVNLSLAKNGTLTITPQVVINRTDTPGPEGNGRCDSSDCELSKIVITGYGFDPNATITRIDLWNINFTNVRYTFTVNLTTTSHGYFNVSNLSQYLRTNMTAGLYVPIVYETLAQQITNFTFRNVYYIVRPLLVLLTSDVIKPGDTVTIAAYGYGPGAAWGYTGYNTLNAYWEKIILLATVPLGKDGNATFQVTIPPDATFGVHYIWGVDKWGYEYSLAIVIGARAYWTIVYPPPLFTPPTIPLSPVVSAGYNNQRIEVCPCPETDVGLSYCSKCVVYSGRCDYLGDIISITLSGLSPGETLTVYFGDIPVATTTANGSVATISFVVPTVPQGTYQLVVVGSVSGTINVSSFRNGITLVGNDTSPVYPQVAPKLLLLDLNKDIAPILVGQGIVRVIGTGFPPGASVLAMLINNTDAGYSLNLQVQRWTSDSKGVLKSSLSPTLGLFIPVLEPGAYAISLSYVLPDATAPKLSTTMPGYVYVINNVSRLVDKDYFNNAVNSLSKQISDVGNDVKTYVKSALTDVSSTLQQLNSAVTSGFDSVNKKIDSAQQAIASAITSASSSLGSKIDAVSSSVSAVSSKVDSIASTVSDISSKVSTLDTLDSAIAKLSDAVNSVNSAVQQLTGLTSKVDSISSAVSTLDNKVDALTDAVNSVSSKVDNVASKVDSAAGSLSNAISGVGSKVDTVSGKVDSVSSKIDTVSGSLSGKIDSATSTLQTYIIITLVLALIAAATSIYAAIQLGRKLAA